MWTGPISNRCAGLECWVGFDFLAEMSTTCSFQPIVGRVSVLQVFKGHRGYFLVITHIASVLSCRLWVSLPHGVASRKENQIKRVYRLVAAKARFAFGVYRV